jgi:hypothetical protein
VDLFEPSVVSIAREEKGREPIAPEENDGLTLSAAPRPAIRLDPEVSGQREASVLQSRADAAEGPYAQLNWLSRPISARTLSWLVDSLVVTAALLMFALIFLSIAHELPPWPLTVGTVLAGAIVVAAGYWVVFSVFGGSSLGARLAQAVSSPGENEESDDGVRIR